METNRFPSIFPIRIPTRSGRRTPAGRTDFGALSCSPALRHLLLAATTHTTPCAGKLLILLKKAKYFRESFYCLVQNKHSTRSGYEASETMLIFVIMGGQWMDGFFGEPSARAVNSPPPSCYKDSIEQVAPAYAVCVSRTKLNRNKPVRKHCNILSGKKECPCSVSGSMCPKEKVQCAE